MRSRGGLAARPSIAAILRVTPGHAGDGDRQRHPRLVLRRRPVPRRRAGDRARPRARRRRAPTCSTSAASRRARAPRRCAPRSSSSGSCPVVEGLAGRRAGVPISVDTSKAAVAAAALDAGAAIVNDVTALRADPELAALCAERGCTVVLMHMLGEPADDAGRPALRRRRRRRPRVPRRADRGRGRRRNRRAADLDRSRDRVRQDASSTTSSCCGASASSRELGRPIVIGTSRKRFLGTITGREVGDRVGARSPRTCSRSPPAPRSSASTTWPRRARRSTPRP